jgi:hypothetical protein
VQIARSTLVAVAILSGTLCAGAAGCSKGERAPKHRERSAQRDADCREPERPRAYFYPAENRTDYGPDDPKKDGCALLVADHLFCCPDAVRATDR